MPGKVAEHSASAGGGLVAGLTAVAVVLNFFSDSLPFAKKEEFKAAQDAVEQLQKEVRDLKAAANKMAWELAWARYGDSEGPPPPPELLNIP